MTDRAKPLFPTERVLALMLAIATLRRPDALTVALAAEHLCAVLYAESSEQIYTSAFEATLFASSVIGSRLS